MYDAFKCSECGWINGRAGECENCQSSVPMVPVTWNGWYGEWLPVEARQ